ncbi:MAG: hypothetical protein LUG48_23965, partial [Klebsiella quasipneumoniae]|nr:hypothetical protein [Klebsiella quasipneumoniae]
MKQMRNRILSIVMVAAMAVSLTPSAFASEVELAEFDTQSIEVSDGIVDDTEDPNGLADGVTEEEPTQPEEAVEPEAPAQPEEATQPEETVESEMPAQPEEETQPQADDSAVNAATTVVTTASDNLNNVDFTWYSTNDTTFTITTPQQWNALAWIVSGQITSFQSIVETVDAVSYTGTIPTATDTFEGKTILLGADLDFGAQYDAATGVYQPDEYVFLPVGGTYYYMDSSANLQFSGAFYGSFDGQGHKMTGICADYQTTGTQLGVFGQVSGTNSVIENLWIGEGLFRTYASGAFVGGVASRMNGTNSLVQNCVNESTIIATNTKGKGIGGIVGAAWYGQGVYNCANFGNVSGMDYALAGVIGMLQSTAKVVNSYNTGVITDNSDNEFAGIAQTKDTTAVVNCYYDPDGTGIAIASSTRADLTQTFLDAGCIGMLDASMTGAVIAGKLNGISTRTWVEDPDMSNRAIPRIFSSATDDATVTSVVVAQAPAQTAYVEGQTFNTTGMVVSASYSDGTYEQVSDVTVDRTSPFTFDDVGSVVVN